MLSTSFGSIPCSSGMHAAVLDDPFECVLAGVSQSLVGTHELGSVGLWSVAHLHAPVHLPDNGAVDSSWGRMPPLMGSQEPCVHPGYFTRSAPALRRELCGPQRCSHWLVSTRAPLDVLFDFAVSEHF